MRIMQTSNMTRIIIAGSRGFNDYDFLENKVIKILKELRPGKALKIISGTANGADKMGERFAFKYGIDVKRLPAQWDTYGKRAGYVRNNLMAEYAMSDNCRGVLIAFWDGKSKGTKMMIDIAERKCLEVFVIVYNE